MEGKRRSGLVIGIFVLLIFYAVGFAGLQYDETKLLMQRFVPFNLLLSATILLLFHSRWNLAVFVFFLLVTLASFMVEMIGVSTGKIFGAYHYGNVLGWSIASTPLIIGLNWMMLIYCVGNLIMRIGIVYPWRELAGAAVMTFIDFLIEPVAVYYGWWIWEGARIPVQNYIAWFFLSFIFLYFFFRRSEEMKNRIAVPLLLIQAVFFLLLNYSLN